MSIPRSTLGLVAAVLALALSACDSDATAASGTLPAATDPGFAEDGEPEPAATAQAEPVAKPTTDEPVDAAIGDALELSQWDESIGTITVLSAATSTRPHDDYGDGPKNGVFVIFAVTVEADASFDVYDGDFYVLADDGTRYDLNDGNSTDAIDYDEALGWVELHTGDKKSGKLAFDLTSEHGRLAYAPNYDSGPIGVWTF